MTSTLVLKRLCFWTLNAFYNIYLFRSLQHFFFSCKCERKACCCLINVITGSETTSPTHQGNAITNGSEAITAVEVTDIFQI